MLTDEQVVELKQKHGDRLMALEQPVEMVFKAPPRSVWAEFQESISRDKGTREGAYRRLCLKCAVHPQMSDIERVFDEYPGLPTKVGDRLAELVGIGDDFEVKKL